MTVSRSFTFTPTVVLFSICFIALGVFLTVKNAGITPKSSVTVGGKTFTVDLADTVQKRTMGLSGTPPLPQNQGMFFIFNEEGNYGFWMKDMNYPIDIIWMDENFVITRIEGSLSPETYPQVYYSDKPSKYVLEISAGQSDLLDLKVGDKAKFSRSKNLF